MKFTSKDYNGVEIEMEVPEDFAIDDVLEYFQKFLRANGYMIDWDQELMLVDVT